MDTKTAALYRAQSYDTKEWVEGYLDCSGKRWKLIYRSGNKLISIQPRTSTVCRIAHQEAKTNQRYYEGDILKAKYGAEYLLVWSSYLLRWEMYYLLDGKGHKSDHGVTPSVLENTSVNGKCWDENRSQFLKLFKLLKKIDYE